MKTPIKSIFATSILCLSQLASGVSFQDLTYGYDVFVKGDATLNGASVHGSIATGGTLKLEGNQSLFGSRAIASDHVIAADSIALTSGGQMAGNLNLSALRLENKGASQSLSSSGLSDSSTGKSLTFQNPQTGSVGPLGIDFDASFSAFQTLSNDLRNLTPTLDFSTLIPDLNNWNYTIGNSNTTHVLNLTGAELNSIRGMNFTTLLSATDKLVVNVDLTGFNGVIGGNRNGEEASDFILWNFYGDQVSSVSLVNQFVGSILATDLHVDHNNNQIKGSVVADSLSKSNGQIHVHRFDYEVEVPDSSSTLVLALLAIPALIGLRRRFN